MTAKEARGYMDGLYSLSYGAAYERLKSEAPGWSREDVLSLLPRMPYIPEWLPSGSVGEKVHAATAELVLARALVLMGMKVMVPRRQDNNPDVLALTHADTRAVIDVKCQRHSRGTFAVKDAKVYTLDAWRDATRLIHYGNFPGPMSFVESVHCDHHHPGTTVLPQLNGLSERDYSMDTRDEAEWAEALEDTLHESCSPGRQSFMRQLGAMETEKWAAHGAVLVVPYLRFADVKGRINEECCDLDVTLLSWEHVYAALQGGAVDDERTSLDALWHLTRTIRRRRHTHDWKKSLFAEEDELLAAMIPSCQGKPGLVRNLIGEMLEAESAVGEESKQWLLGRSSLVARMSEAQLRAEVLRLWNVEGKTAAITTARAMVASWQRRRGKG